MTVTIRHLHCRYRWSGSPERATAARARLDDIVRSEISEAFASSVAADEGDDAPVIVVRELRAPWQVSFRGKEGVAPVRRVMASQFRAAITRELNAPSRDNVVRFASQAQFVARFLGDLAQGESWSRWYYYPFDAISSLPVDQAIRRALFDHRKHARAIVRELILDGRLDQVMSHLSDSQLAEWFLTWGDSATSQRDGHRPSRSSLLTAIREGSREAEREEMLFDDRRSFAGDAPSLELGHATASSPRMGDNGMAYSSLDSKLTAGDTISADFSAERILSSDLPIESWPVDLQNAAAIAQSLGWFHGRPLTDLRRLLSEFPRRGVDSPNPESNRDGVAEVLSFLAQRLARDNAPRQATESSPGEEAKQTGRTDKSLDDLQVRRNSSTPAPAERARQLDRDLRLAAIRGKPWRTEGRDGNVIAAKLYQLLLQINHRWKNDGHARRLIQSVVSQHLAASDRGNSTLGRSGGAAEDSEPACFAPVSGREEARARNEIVSILESRKEACARMVPTVAGGIWFLIRAIDDSRLIDIAERSNFPAVGSSGGAALRLALARKWIGEPVSLDPGIAIFADIDAAYDAIDQVIERVADPDRIETFERDWRDVLERLRLEDAWGAFGEGPDFHAKELPSFASAGMSPVDRCIGLAGETILAIWRKWLRGMQKHSFASLAQTFIRRPGTLEIDSHRVRVRLVRQPLDLVLDVSGYAESIEQVAWLGGRRVEFAWISG